MAFLLLRINISILARQIIMAASPTPRTTLDRLPAELQQEIYRYCLPELRFGGRRARLGSQRRMGVSWCQVMAIANTSRRCQMHFLWLFHQHFICTFPNLARMEGFLRSCRPLHRECIRNVDVVWGIPREDQWAHDAWDMLSRCCPNLTSLEVTMGHHESVGYHLPGSWMLLQIRGLSHVGLYCGGARTWERDYFDQLQRDLRQEQQVDRTDPAWRQIYDEECRRHSRQQQRQTQSQRLRSLRPTATRQRRLEGYRD